MAMRPQHFDQNVERDARLTFIALYGTYIEMDAVARMEGFSGAANSTERLDWIKGQDYDYKRHLLTRVHEMERGIDADPRHWYSDRESSPW
jgi:hypothetical protein